jgi:hypothetical protein
MKKTIGTQLRHLEHKHHRLDTELEELMNHEHLTPGEYEQVNRLKKRKLVLKDGITALRQDLAR